MRIRNLSAYGVSIAALGAGAMITQLVLLREFLSLFNGNELIIGIVLAGWMLLTGLGAKLGRLFGERSAFVPAALHILLGILPAGVLWLLRILRNELFDPGRLPGLFEAAATAVVAMLPFCILSGMLLTIYSRRMSAQADNKISDVYALDTLGAIAGGAVFSFLFVYILNAFHNLYAVAIINFAAAAVIAAHSTASGAKRPAFWLAIGLIIAAGAVSFLPLSRDSLGELYAGQKILDYQISPYGRVVATQSGEQINFYENGVYLFSTGNTIQAEESVHYVMVQRPEARSVLMISGGASGAAKEILKYGPKKIDYVEVNPAIISIAGEYTDNLAEEKINVIQGDGRSFIRETENKYDVIIVNTPEPSTAQLNRYYTTEFFEELRRKLTPGGAISVSLPPTPNYVSKEERGMNSVLLATLKMSFDNIEIIPGGKNYYLASDDTLFANIPLRISQQGIKTDYVNMYYLDYFSMKQRADYIRRSADTGAAINRDFEPVAYQNAIIYWLSKFGVKYWILPAVIFIPMLLFVVFMRPVDIGMFTGGFAASGLEIIIMIAFQIFYGYVYHMAGVIITVFMAGMALGAMLAGRREWALFHFMTALSVSFIISLFLPGILGWMHSISRLDVLIIGLLLVITAAVGATTGAMFSSASQVFLARHDEEDISRISSRAGEVFGADLIGSAFGAVAVSLVLIPTLGIMLSCLIIAGFQFVALLYVYLRKGHFY
jgi:spermidine synthase